MESKQKKYGITVLEKNNKNINFKVNNSGNNYLTHFIGNRTGFNHAIIFFSTFFKLINLVYVIKLMIFRTNF